MTTPGQPARYTIPLPGADEPVTVEGPFPLSPHEWEHFMAVLEAMKPGLVTGREEDEP